MANDFDNKEEIEEEYLDLEGHSATNSGFENIKNKQMDYQTIDNNKRQNSDISKQSFNNDNKKNSEDTLINNSPTMRFANDKNRNVLANHPDKASLLKGGQLASIPKGLMQNRGPQNQAKSNAINRENNEKADNSTTDEQNGKNSNSQKSAVDNVKEQVVSKGLSTAAQASGIPAPVADTFANNVAGPLLELQKKKKKMMMMVSIGVVVSFLFIILIFVSTVSGGESGKGIGSSSKNNYLYSSGTKKDLYKYLVQQGYCESIELCEGTPAAEFYETLKKEISANRNLTELQADIFITEFIFYDRSEDEQFATTEEIGYIAKIIGGNGKFDIYDIDKYKEKFIADDGYFNTYRKDLLDKNNTSEYRLKLYNKIAKIAQDLSEVQEKEENISTENTYGYNVNGKIVSNVKVRLLQCSDDTVGEPIAGEELIDFEKYILGVVYAENGGGPEEGLKTQAIASRTYALLRGDSMYNAYNIGLKEQNGQWILSIRNCTEDQVYCNPDKGCWSNSASAGGTVHSGYDESKAYSLPPLADDSIVRTAVADTAYKVLVNSSGALINTGYKHQTQEAWNESANAGKDHFEILKETYSDASKILYAGISTFGDYTTWKQCNQPWSGIKLGNSSSNICDVGCYITSIAIQMAASNTQIDSQEFNPGVLVEHLSKEGGFGSDGSLVAFNWKKLAPSFNYYTSVNISGTKSQKAATIKTYQDQGYYVIIRAKTHQHWVALDKVVGDDVYMFDPATDAVKLWEKYPYYDVTAITVFKNGT